MWARIDEEHNQKEKNVYFSNMKKIIKHYPMTDRLIVRGGYLYIQYYKNENNGQGMNHCVTFSLLIKSKYRED
jgi:hypothetical protein